MRPLSLAACCVVVLARALAACECIGEPSQILLGHAKFMAEVTAVAANEFKVDRVTRGSTTATAVRGKLVPAPRSCCDRIPATVVVGQKYWLIAPDGDSPA